MLNDCSTTRESTRYSKHFSESYERFDAITPVSSHTSNSSVHLPKNSNHNHSFNPDRAVLTYPIPEESNIENRIESNQYHQQLDTRFGTPTIRDLYLERDIGNLLKNIDHLVNDRAEVHLNPRKASTSLSSSISDRTMSLTGSQHSLEVLEDTSTSSNAPIITSDLGYHTIHDKANLPNKQVSPSSSESSMALNFSSHDLLLQPTHQGHSSLNHQHHNVDTGNETKPSIPGSLDLDSNSLMQANMNVWKNTMGLGVGHSFLPGTEMSSFTANWSTHGGNHLGHQTTSQSMTHHILGGEHLISYPQHHHNPSHHQRPISHLQTNQELVGATLKSQAEQAFIMNSINHQVNVSQNSSSTHPQLSQHQTTTTTTTPTNDNLNLRTTQSVDHVTSYNLAINDNHQFYNSSARNDSNRSHVNSVKPSPVFLAERSVPISLSNHHNHHHHHHQAIQISPYHNALNDQVNHSQPISSNHSAGGSGLSNGNLSRNIGNFRCPHCGEMFSMRNLYQNHLKTHSHEKGPKAKFHCEQCGHCFSQKTSLNRHLKSHTGERPFPCDVCGKAFSEKERLKIHMRTHTGEKPFSCGICGKSFSQKSTVKRHQTVHTGEKKFKCDCGKGFANRGNLIAHIKTRGANHFE